MQQFSLNCLQIFSFLVPPSTPSINIVLSNLSPNIYNARISWSSPSDRDADAYYIYRDGIFLAVTNRAEYTDTDQLLADTQYSYSVIANSCAGNSTQGIKNITIESKNIIFVHKLAGQF